MDADSLNAATRDFIQRHLRDDVRQLALRPVPADVDIHAALIQIEGHQLAAHKLPTWAATDGLLFPPRLALEQCSSEATAHYKRQLVRRLLQGVAPSQHPSSGPIASGSFSFPSGAPATTPTFFVDLTAGLGVDFSALASLFDFAIYVERQQSLCDLAAHNLPLLGLTNSEVRCSTAEENLHLQADVVLIDPARRDAAGRKVARLEDCTPDVGLLQESLRSMASFVLIKLSPMLDLADALRSLRGVAEAHVVSVEGECKELLLVMQGTRRTDGEARCLPPSADEVPIHCVDITSLQPDRAEQSGQPAHGTSEAVPPAISYRPLVFSRSTEAATPIVLAQELGTYLYEPNASILKAGAYKSVCHFYPVAKLAPNTHLYTSSQRIEDFPGRTWRILDYATFAKRDLHRLLQATPSADLSVRGFPTSVATLRKQLHLREGGGAHLIATTFLEQRLLLRVERV